MRNVVPCSPILQDSNMDNLSPGNLKSHLLDSQCLIWGSDSGPTKYIAEVLITIPALCPDNTKSVHIQICRISICDWSMEIGRWILPIWMSQHMAWSVQLYLYSCPTACKILTFSPLPNSGWVKRVMSWIYNILYTSIFQVAYNHA